MTMGWSPEEEYLPRFLEDIECLVGTVRRLHAEASLIQLRRAHEDAVDPKPHQRLAAPLALGSRQDRLKLTTRVGRNFDGNTGLSA